MEKTLEKIWKSLKRMHEMHHRHLASFEVEGLPDLESQSRERDIELGELLHNLTRMIRMAETNPEPRTETMLMSINDQLTLLLEENRVLENRVRDFRDQMKKTMSRISAGKKVIGSYRSPARIVNAPRVISVTN